MADHKSEAKLNEPDDDGHNDERPLLASERRLKLPDKPPEPATTGDANNMDYKFLDGLRGIGAFVVYLTHFIAQYYPL